MDVPNQMTRQTSNAIDLTSAALLLLTLVLLALGQVMFKYAAQSIQFSQPRTLLSVPLGLALIVYALATVAWLGVLTRLPLSVAFPFYGLTFLLVPLFARRFLGEPVGWATYVGGLVILVGIAITVLGLKK